MINGVVNVRDFELMVSETEMSKAGKGPMNIEIHWALADELITRLREAEKDASRYRWIKLNVENDDADFVLERPIGECDCAIDEVMKQAMKEKGDE